MVVVNDRRIFADLVRAHKAKAATILVKAARLNRPGSPLWEPVENMAPLFGSLSFSTVMMFFNVLAGTALMILSVVFYFAAIRPWILQRVHRRGLAAATQSLRNFEVLWKNGGLILRIDIANGATCASPTGDWRAFVLQHFPKPQVPGIEAYRSFHQTLTESPKAVAALDVNRTVGPPIAKLHSRRRWSIQRTPSIESSYKGEASMSNRCP